MEANNNDAILLRLNKEEQVAALNELGFNEVTFNTPLSEMADYIRWAGGLRDVRLCCVQNSDSTIHHFTQDEWSALSANARSKYTKLGISVRARKREFVVAPRNMIATGGGNTFKFGGYGTDFKGVQNFGNNSSGTFDHFEGLADTQAVITQTAGKTDSQGITGAPAAEAAWNFKVNEYDPLQWYLPDVATLRLICEFKIQINAALTAFFGSGTLDGDWYWSSTEYDSSSSWYVNMSYGYSNSYGRGSASRVRPVAVVSVAVPPAE